MDKDEKTMYRPLPDCVTVLRSAIHGLGLFATKDIPRGYELGITAIADSRFLHGYIRTPLGGFFNHSDDPNCEGHVSPDGLVRLRTIKKINKGDELTARYNLYSRSFPQGETG